MAKTFRLSIVSIVVLLTTTCFVFLTVYFFPNVVGWAMTIPVYGLVLFSIVLAGMSLVKSIKQARVAKGRKNWILLWIAVMNVFAAALLLRFIVML